MPLQSAHLQRKIPPRRERNSDASSPRHYANDTSSSTASEGQNEADSASPAPPAHLVDNVPGGVAGVTLLIEVERIWAKRIVDNMDYYLVRQVVTEPPSWFLSNRISPLLVADFE